MLQRQIRFVLVATMIANKSINEVYFVMGGKGEITVDAVILSVCFECIIDYKIIDAGILISSHCYIYSTFFTRANLFHIISNNTIINNHTTFIDILLMNIETERLLCFSFWQVAVVFGHVL
jgi:hypothetical protein